VRDGLTYRIFGYKGKQVRDNIHSYDVCTAIVTFAERPTAGAVYNLGGGRANSVSVLEAIARLEELYGRRLATEYVEEPRRGDHICYITDLRRLRADYPDWEITVGLDALLEDVAGLRAPQEVAP
jgi:CDP-paratose 2-epimerase